MRRQRKGFLIPKKASRSICIINGIVIHSQSQVTTMPQKVTFAYL